MGEKRRTKIYVAGPLTQGDVIDNVSKAVDAGDILFELGYAPYVPHLNLFWHYRLIVAFRFVEGRRL